MNGQGVESSGSVLVGTVSVDRKSVRAGETVRFKFTVRNPSRQPARVSFTSGKRFDIEVSRKPEPNARYAKGALTIWQWSQGRAFTMALGDVIFAPGETKTYLAEWKPSGDVPECDAVVRAWLPVGKDELAVAVSTLRIGGGR